MITKFDTSAVAPTQATGGKSSNTLLYVLIGAVVLYLGYKYVLKPQMEKNKEQENK